MNFGMTGKPCKQRLGLISTQHTAVDVVDDQEEAILNVFADEVDLGFTDKMLSINDATQF